jgi:hypothetical protein
MPVRLVMSCLEHILQLPALHCAAPMTYTGSEVAGV